MWKNVMFPKIFENGRCWGLVTKIKNAYIWKSVIIWIHWCLEKCLPENLPQENWFSENLLLRISSQETDTQENYLRKIASKICPLPPCSLLRFILLLTSSYHLKVVTFIFKLFIFTSCRGVSRSLITSAMDLLVTLMAFCS